MVVISAIPIEYIKVFTSSLDRERAAGVSLFGPHRDDIKLGVNGKDSRLFASQGQQRSCVLALKLAEGEVIHSLKALLEVPFSTMPIFSS